MRFLIAFTKFYFRNPVRNSIAGIVILALLALNPYMKEAKQEKKSTPKIEYKASDFMPISKGNY